MIGARRVSATFVEPRAAAAAIRALRAARCPVRAAMPVPFSEVLAALDGPPSELGRVSLAGALAGAAAGALLTAGTSLAWPIVTGGKPVVSLPPFVIVTFELAVLVASLATVGGLLLGCLRSAAERDLPPLEALAGDRIALLASGDPRVAEAIVLAAGAVEVRRVV